MQKKTTQQSKEGPIPTPVEQSRFKSTHVVVITFVCLLAFTALAVMSTSKANASDDLEPEDDRVGQVILVEAEEGSTSQVGFIEWVDGKADAATKWTQHSFQVIKVKISEIMDTAEELEAQDKAEQESTELTEEETSAVAGGFEENEVTPDVKSQPTVMAN